MKDKILDLVSDVAVAVVYLTSFVFLVVLVLMVGSFIKEVLF